MISTSTLKLIRSLRHKKFRDQHGLYCAEGEKIILELIRRHPGGDHRLEQLFATGEWIKKNREALDAAGIPYSEATPGQLKKASSLVTPQPVLALVRKPAIMPDFHELGNAPLLGFESIRDPGNLGSIIRTADWFGFGHLVCSPDSTDLYNPKVIQSTMGAIARVRVHYLDLETLLKEPAMKEKHVYATFLEGRSVYETVLEKAPLILFGNESRGLTRKYDPYIHTRITIPSFKPPGNGSESLNLAASVAVICSEIRRRV
ncbi:MAG: RNA methyltransferase [Bacteroidales bacterium]